MVRIQNSQACADKLLIGSDLPSCLAARRELEQWVAQSGYRVARGGPRHLSVFEAGALVREWIVVESAPERKRFSLFAFLRRGLRRPVPVPDTGEAVTSTPSAATQAA